VTVLDPNGIQLTTDASKQIQPAVAAIGNNFLVAWTDPRNFATSLDDIYGQVVDSDGTLSGANFAISANPEDETTPAVTAASASAVLVAYSKQRTDVDAARLVTRMVETLQIVVAPANTTIAKGTTQQFTATGVNPDGTTQDVTSTVTWATSDASIAPITSGGLASGTAQGSVTITATLGAASGSTTLTVGPPALVSIAVTPAGATIAKGTTKQFAAKGTYSDGTTQDLTASVTWGSSSPLTAPISGSGLATGQLQGTTTISATLGTVTGSTTLTIGPPTLVSIDVEPAIPSIAKGATQTFTATGTYTDLSTLDLTASATWNSANTAVATITSGGTATAVGAGTSTIRATLGGVTGSTVLTVTAATLSSCDVQPEVATVAPNTTTQFTAIAIFSDSTTQDVTTTASWSTSNTAVATVSTQGLATSVAAGTANITASMTINGQSCSAFGTLTVTSATLLSIAVTPATASIAKATTQQFTATGKFSDGTTQDLTTLVTWGSSNAAIATVSNTSSNQGLATGVAPGTATISASLSGVTGSGALTVTSASVVSIAVTPATMTLPKAFKQQYTAVGTFSDGTTQDITNLVTWTSTNTAAATISNATGSHGLATALAAGTTTIKATMSSVTGTATLITTNATLVSIAVTPSSTTLAVGHTQQLTATGKFSDGSTLNITTQVSWKSSNKKNVSVSHTGLATAIKQSTTATITAKKGNVSGTATITVP
jgi:hypothetical protein